MRTLEFNEIQLASGGDQGDSATMGMVAGAIAGGTWTTSAARGAFWGVRIGSFAGPVGMIIGGSLGGLAGWGMYELATS